MWLSLIVAPTVQGGIPMTVNVNREGSAYAQGPFAIKSWARRACPSAASFRGGRAVPYAATDPVIRVTLTCSFKHLLTSLQDGFLGPVEAALGSDPIDAAVIALFVVTQEVTFEPLLSSLN